MKNTPSLTKYEIEALEILVDLGYATKKILKTGTQEKINKALRIVESRIDLEKSW
jgi:hypothetical protein